MRLGEEGRVAKVLDEIPGAAALDVKESGSPHSLHVAVCVQTGSIQGLDDFYLDAARLEVLHRRRPERRDHLLPELGHTERHEQGWAIEPPDPLEHLDRPGREITRPE